MLKLYNTLTKQDEEFIPLNPSNVGMYICGPTVYDYFHIGNARTFIMADIIRRYLEYKGYAVKFVMNLTDIDDTMRNGLGLSMGPFELADKIGLDKVERWMDNLYGEFGDIKYKASPILKRHVRAHQYGRATGKGFYSYDASGKKIG